MSKEKEGTLPVPNQKLKEPLQSLPLFGVPLKKRKKSRKNKNKQSGQQIAGRHKKGFLNNANSKYNSPMSSWNEVFNSAALWQYKHQIAYWKAKAKALEYENHVLHNIIRMKAGSSKHETESNCPSEFDSTNKEMDFVNDCHEETFNEEEHDLEVSQDFIEFLTANAKFKEDAKREREKFSEQNNSETEEDYVKRMEQPPCKSDLNNSDTLKNLYGSDWQRISALEMSLQCQFLSVCDKRKPIYWPNIPFNFNYS